jgi:hypothetical protein
MAWQTALFPVIFFSALIAAIVYIAARHLILDERE